MSSWVVWLGCTFPTFLRHCARVRKTHERHVIERGNEIFSLCMQKRMFIPTSKQKKQIFIWFKNTFFESNKFYLIQINHSFKLKKVEIYSIHLNAKKNHFKNIQNCNNLYLFKYSERVDINEIFKYNYRDDEYMKFYEKSKET